MGSVVGVESVYLGFGKIKDFAGGDHPKADFPPGDCGIKRVSKRSGAQKPSGMVTKGNKMFAGSAGIRESERRGDVARRASIYGHQRVNEANLEVVRDTGFEPVTPTVSR